MSYAAQREMTLRELVDHLPTGNDGMRQIRHKAYKELQELARQRDALREALAEVLEAYTQDELLLTEHKARKILEETKP